MSNDTTPTVSVAMASTRHFDFVATGATPEDARTALMAGWRAHAKQTGADPNYLAADDINVVTGPLGQAWRDYSPLLTPAANQSHGRKGTHL